MSAWRERLRSEIERAREAFSRLTQREQIMVLGGGAAVVLIILLAIGWMVSSAIDNTERRVLAKTDQLQQLMALQSEYKAREAQRQARLRELRGSNIRLVSLVEDAARQSGVEIGQLKPDDKEASTDGIVESVVELSARNLSADRLQDFLARLEGSPGVVIIQRLKLSRPYRKDSVDLEMTVSTYHAKS